MSLIVPFPDAKHRMKSARIQSFSGSYYSAFGLNTERYGAPLPIHSKREKNTDQKHSEYKLELEYDLGFNRSSLKRCQQS